MDVDITEEPSMDDESIVGDQSTFHDCSLPDMNMPTVVRESLILEQSVHEMSADMDDEDMVITYTVGENASKGGGTKLFDSLGYSYVVRRVSASHTTWRCSVKNKHTKCKKQICQNGQIFTDLGPEHIHQPVVGSLITALQTSCNSL